MHMAILNPFWAMTGLSFLPLRHFDIPFSRPEGWDGSPEKVG